MSIAGSGSEGGRKADQLKAFSCYEPTVILEKKKCCEHKFQNITSASYTSVLEKKNGIKAGVKNTKTLMKGLEERDKNARNNNLKVRKLVCYGQWKL